MNCEVKDLRDRVEAVRRYVKASRKGLQAQNQAAYVKLLCERRAGELLAGLPRVKAGGRKKNEKDSVIDSTRESIGISKSTIHRWQMFARYPEAKLLELVAFCNEESEELTTMVVV